MHSSKRNRSVKRSRRPLNNHRRSRRAFQTQRLRRAPRRFPLKRHPKATKNNQRTVLLLRRIRRVEPKVSRTSLKNRSKRLHKAQSRPKPQTRTTTYLHVAIATDLFLS